MDRSFLDARSGYDRDAVAAHETEMAKPQRIAPIAADDLSDEALGIINHIRASVGAGPTDRSDVPKYFLTMVKHPAMFRHQLDMGAAIFTGVFPARQRELAVLRIAWLTRAPYEWGEHVDIGKRVGLTPEEIERVIDGASAAGWSTRDAAILHAVEELLTAQVISDATWGELAAGYDEQQLIEFLMIVGQYTATALLQNALRIRLERDNRGLTQR